MANLKRFVLAFVLARAELQGALIVTANVVAMATMWDPSPDLLAGINAMLGTWFAVAQAMLFRRDVAELGRLGLTNPA